MAQIFRDFTESTFTLIEGSKGDGCMRARGIFQKQDTRNINNRIYSSSLWEKVLNEDRVKDMLEARRMLGEVEHPTDSTTNLSRVSHIVTKLYREGNDIIGEAEILNTPSGLIIQELLRRKVPVGISSRGRGSSVQKNGVEYVNPEDFVLETFDFVYKPSTPGAYPELQESVLAGSPYAKNTTMAIKIDQVKKFDVRAGEISGTTGKLSTAELLAMHKECVEMRASLQTLVEGMSEPETKEHGEYAKQVSTRIDSAFESVTQRLDKVYAVSDLSRRVESVISSDKTGNDVYKDLLKEAQQENGYLRTRLDEITELTESSEDEILRRYNAAAQLANETLDKLQETTSALTELTVQHETLEKRYEAAVELVAGVQEHQAAGRLAYLVREALDDYPELGKFAKTLRACKTESELAERVEELVEGLGLGKKTEADLTSRLKISAALSEDVGTESNEAISESVLPKIGKKLKTAPVKEDQRRGKAEKILETAESASNGDDEFLNDLLESQGLS